MAVTDAYATASEYRERVDKEDTTDDVQILAQLTAASRYIERCTNRFFNIDATAVSRWYDGAGGSSMFIEGSERVTNGQPVGRTRFYIPDDIGSTSGLEVYVDLNGDSAAEQLLTLDTHFFLGPYNNGLGAEPQPYRWFQIVPNNGVIDTWPTNLHSIKVTAKYGWPAVPQPIKEITMMLARQIRDIQMAGVTLTIQNLDAGVELAPDVNKMLSEIKMKYGRTRKRFV